MRRWKRCTIKYQWDGKTLPASFSPPDASDPALGITKIKADFSVDGFATYVWTYETAQEDNSGGGSGDNRNVKTYVLEGSLNKEPITRHIDFPKWISFSDPSTKKKYGRVEKGEVIWELEDPAPGKGKKRGGLSKDGEWTDNINPLYGVTDFFDVSAVWVVEDVHTRGQTIGLLNNIGKIANPAGYEPKIEGSDGMRRNWLYSGASMTQVGAKFIVRRTWLLSGPGGWIKAIYAADETTNQ